ncbi:MAG: hypothetical protein EBR18_00865 [Betaproteobacteria bacterium]|nr:hypothetical protein [Betaproteobacteria bacterium]
MFEWMAWTLPVAVFFISIGLMLFGMTVWEMRSPTEPRKGFLPMETTRGLLCAAYVHLAFVGLGGRMTEWFALDAEPSIWIATGISAVVLAAVMRKG